MEYSVCTASILMYVLECIVSIEINMFILISSRSNHLISNARAYMDQKNINDRALFSGLIRGFETYSNLLRMIISRWINVCWPTMHKFSISEYHDRNRLLSLGLYFKSLDVSCHSKWCICPQSHLFDGTVMGWRGMLIHGKYM